MEAFRAGRNIWKWESVMEIAIQQSLHGQLVERRSRLRDAIRTEEDDESLVRLLGMVDAALARFDRDEFGRCLICRELVHEADLQRNPLLEYCLCDFTPQQQQALQHDLNLARRLQGGLLPDPNIHACGWQVHYHYEPSGFVGGDYCDVRVEPCDSGTMFFTIADVSGKGVAASLLMAHLQSAFRSRLGTGMRLSNLVESVNLQMLEASIPTHYATVACGQATSDGQIEIVNAGHCPLLVVRRSGVETVGSTGIPVGLLKDAEYESAKLHLEEGDTLVLYTDGLTEASIDDDEEYGAERLRSLLARDGAAEPRGIVQAIRADVAAFLGGKSLVDDLTVMAVKRDVIASHSP
jgi:sigma-B regulation protein RsbU (phosphoserine phosphatase)